MRMEPPIHRFLHQYGKEEEQTIHYLSLAFLTAQNLSKDPSTKVGALIVSPDGRQISTGYNGFPKGVVETPELWERPTKYEWLIHAEMNAILNAPFDTVGCTMYSTLQPCHRCLVHMVNAGITTLFYYGFDPKYADGKYPLTDEAVWNSCAPHRTVKVPKNELIESIRALYR